MTETPGPGDAAAFRSEYSAFCQEAAEAAERFLGYVRDALAFEGAYVSAGGVLADLPVWDVVKLRPHVQFAAEWLQAAFATGTGASAQASARARPPMPRQRVKPGVSPPPGTVMEAAAQLVRPRRWYVAWHPDVAFAILRSKDTIGLRGWRARQWHAFPDPPVVIDVTHSMGGLFATLAQPDGRARAAFPEQKSLDAVLVIRAAGPDVLLRARGAPPLDGEVANLTWDLRASWCDLAGREAQWLGKVLAPPSQRPRANLIG